MITLYKKTHNKTGLKYFGKTTKDDPYTYHGSGKYWKRHLKKHGFDISTEIILQHTDLEVIKELALFYSEENDIVNSKEWANLKEELGTDGGSLKEWHTEESRKKMSDNRKGKVGRPAGWKHTDKTREKMSKSAIARGAPVGCWKPGAKPWITGKTMTEEHKKKVSEGCKNQKKYTCEHCGKMSTGGNYTRWHGNNCKYK